MKQTTDKEAYFYFFWQKQTLMNTIAITTVINRQIFDEIYRYRSPSVFAKIMKLTAVSIVQYLINASFF